MFKGPQEVCRLAIYPLAIQIFLVQFSTFFFLFCPHNDETTFSTFLKGSKTRCQSFK